MSLRDYLFDARKRGYLIFKQSFLGLINCGALSIIKDTTTGIDSVGKSTRDAVQAETILGDGATHIRTTIIPNQNTVVVVGGNFKDTSIQFMGSRTGSYYFGFGIQDGLFKVAWNSLKGSTATADTDFHEFRVEDGVLYIDDVPVNGTQGEILNTIDQSIQFLSVQRDTIPNYLPSNFDMLYARIIHNGITYTLNTKPDNNQYQLVPDDGSAPIICQQFLSPAQPTETNITEVSLQDEHGVTIADGTQYKDQALTNAFQVGYPIPNYPNSNISTAYVTGGVHPIGDYNGRIKINVTDGGTTIALSDTYNHIAKYDDQRILTNADGTPKVITKATQPNVENNQFFSDFTVGKILFFDKSLSGDCLVKANQYMGL